MKGETLISKNGVREFLKKNNMRIATGTFEQIDQDLRAWLLKGAKRASANHRTTVMPQDL